MNKIMRQRVIRDLIATRDLRTQDALLAILRQKGIRVTQATLSRDLREMGVTKMPEGLGGAAYKVLADRMPMTEKTLQIKFASVVQDVIRTGNLILVKTVIGEAQGVSRVVDNAKIPGILGTVAGDDTILVVTEDPVQARKTALFFRDLMKKA